MPIRSPYSLLLLAAIVVTLLFWRRLARRDERLLMIYVAALGCAFIGAKLVYLAAEGWMFRRDPNRWLFWATGKTILGALLGGYCGVELAKKALGYRAATGDFFALVAPVGILLGRVGCLLHGCCLGEVCAPAWWTMRDAAGVARWPAVPLEILFNVLALSVFFAMRNWRSAGNVGATVESLNAGTGALPESRGLLPGQHFHLYLIAYGLFRFGHEFVRATPRIGSSFSGYQAAALAVLALGVFGFLRRQRRFA